MKGVKDITTGRFVKNLTAKQCEICESDFSPRFDKQKTCGMECRDILLGLTFSKQLPKVCHQCGGDYTVPPSQKDSKFCSIKCRIDSGVSIKYGADSVLWKGGITPESKMIRTSLEYRLWREAVFERDDYICQNPECGVRGGELNAHHIRPFSQYPELRLAIDNGLTLCQDCHKQMHRKENN